MNEDVLLDQNGNTLILSSYNSEELDLQINIDPAEEVESENDLDTNTRVVKNLEYRKDELSPEQCNINSDTMETVECEDHLNSAVDLEQSQNQHVYTTSSESLSFSSSQDGFSTGVMTISDDPDPVRTQWVTTKKNKSRLQKSGHTWKKGTWRENEIQQLKENIARYCNDRGIKDPQDVIFHMGKEERKDFYPTISAGLNRPLFAVYRRVRRMYDKQNHRGKYTDEEIKYLKQLVAKYGKNWTVIGQHMGRSSDSVRDRCRLFVKEDTNNLGKWTEEEEEKLAEAVRKVTGKDLEGDNITNGITWSSVAKMVRGRTEKQCRSKWLNYLNWKLNKGEKWTKSDDQMLVERLIECDVASDDEIDWGAISCNWRSVRSPQWLRFKFWSLKRLFTTTYPNRKITSFKELLVSMHVLVCSKVYNSWSRNWLDKKTCEQNDAIHEVTSVSKITDSDREKWLNDCFLNSCSKSASPAMNDEASSCEDNESTTRLKISDQMLDVSSSDPMLIAQDETEVVDQEVHDLSEDNSHVTVQFPSSVGVGSQGIYLRQNPEGRNSECQLMICDYNNQYNMNIQLTPEILNLLHNSTKPIQVGVVPQQFHNASSIAEPSDADINIQSSNILDYTVSKGNTSPVLSSVMQDMVVGNSSSDESNNTHLHGEFLLDGTELAASDGDGQ